METKEQIKETGATFTPESLANFLAEKIHTYSNNLSAESVIVDPACGDGVLLKSMGKKICSLLDGCNLHGYDTNKNYLKTAKQNLQALKEANLELSEEDFLELIDIQNESDLDIIENDNKKKREFADIIIANPPYVRTQILGAEKAQKIAKKFNLTGRVDLYYPFLIAMTHALKENGIIGVITSNRYLVTKSGNSIREFLYKNYEVLEVIDLGDTKLFDAAVLPAIFIGRKKKNMNNSSAKFSKIYEFSDKVNGQKAHRMKDLFHILNDSSQGLFCDDKKYYKKSSGIIKFPKSKENTWVLLSGEEARWVENLESNCKERIKDSFKVKVGIKTTADKVFISNDWTVLGKEIPEEETLLDLISQENIQAWTISNEVKLKVLYTHNSLEGKNVVKSFDEFPNAKNYLESHSEILKGRKYVENAGKKWYEIWVPQKAHLWKFPKVVFPDISESPRFCIDDTGKIVNGNCYWIVATNDIELEKLYLIIGIANSKTMTKYHDLISGNKLYSGRRRYFSQYVQNYPLPSMDNPYSKEIISIAKELSTDLHKESENKLIERLEESVLNAFGLK